MNDFRVQIQATGMTPPDVIEPGKLHRFPGIDKGNGNTAGWCKLFDDGEGGVYGDWSTGLNETWQARRDTPLTPVQKQDLSRKVAAVREQANAERERQYICAAERATTLWKEATPADSGHAYLTAKAIEPYGARLHEGALVISVRSGGTLQSLQFIYPDGSKKFMPGGKTTCGYFSIGKPTGAKVLCIAEGFATGATIHQATGYPVAVAFNAGNLESVARVMLKRFPDLPLIICADDDAQTKGNPGLSKAKAAAQAVGGAVATPTFGSPRPDGVTDFNDMAALINLEAVAEAIHTAVPVDDPVINESNHVTTQETDEPYIEWGVPVVIESKLKPVPALSESLIPEPCRAWVLDVAHRMQTPPDFVAVTAMTVIASIIGTACAIRPKQRDSWTVIPNLWGACIGRPSVMLKSPSMKEPIDMLVRLQAEAGEAYSEEMRSHEVEMEVASAKKKAAKSALNKAIKVKDDAAIDNSKHELLVEKELPEPVRRLYKTNETSVQSQTKLQTENPRGLLTFRDELTALLSNWDKEANADERAYFLEGWNGDGSHTDYKIGRGLTEAEHICISLFGGIQPDKLKRYLHQSINGMNDGLMQRLQLAVYPDEPQNWKFFDEYPDTKEKSRVYEILKSLAHADFSKYGAEQGEYDRFPYLSFTKEAQEVFNEWLTDLQTDKLPNEENSLMAEHLGKYRSLMPSLALIIHLVGMTDSKASGPVSKQAAIQAAAWCDYLEEHARRIYGIVTSPEQEAASLLAERIHKLPSPFTTKDVYRKHWGGLPDTAAVESACRVLEDEDWLYREPGKQTGGRPSAAKYWVNPSLKKEKK